MNRFAAIFVALASLAVIPGASAQTPPQAPPQVQPAGPAQPTAQENAAYLAANMKKKGVIVKPSGLQFRIIRNGFGSRPALTDTVTVYYTGKLINGLIFDGTSPGLPASLPVNRLVPGWVEALLSMRIGDRWELVIPSKLGYGVQGKGGSIGPNQTLVFDLELLATKPAPKRGERGYIPEPGEEPNR